MMHNGFLYNTQSTEELIRESEFISTIPKQLFTLSNTPLPDTLRVFVQGLLKTEGPDYSLAGDVVTLFPPAPVDSNVHFFYKITNPFVPYEYKLEDLQLDIGETLTQFILRDIPISTLEEVYVQGLLKTEGIDSDYTISDKTITFNDPLTIVEKTFISVRYPVNKEI